MNAVSAVLEGVGAGTFTVGVPYLTLRACQAVRARWRKRLLKLSEARLRHPSARDLDKWLASELGDTNIRHISRLFPRQPARNLKERPKT